MIREFDMRHPLDSSQKTSIVAIIVSYNGLSDLSACLDSLAGADKTEIDFRVVVVDNHSTDGTREFLLERTATTHTVLLSQNVGYGAGVNAGWRLIQESDWNIDFVCILNQDIVVDHDWLPPLVQTMETHPTVAICQPQILLKQQPDCVNVNGLECHFLGFAYVVDYGKHRLDAGLPPHHVAAASGATIMLRTSVFAPNEDIFAEDLFMYGEDVELSWIMRCRGFACMLVPASTVLHDYNSTGYLRNYFLLERNRWKIVLTHFPASLLLLSLPAFILMELAQLLWASLNGLFLERIRLYRHFCRPTTVIEALSRRKIAITRNTILKYDICVSFSGHLQVQERENGVLFRILNKTLCLYWQLLKVVW